MRLWASAAQTSQAAVGEEVPRRDVLEARPLLQVADGQLDGGVGPVEGVDLDRGAFPIR